MNKKVKNNLDQFYTKKDIAQKCVDFFESKVGKLEAFSNIIEPSAGSGNILQLLPHHAIGLDISPANENVFKQDYLNYFPDCLDNEIVVFGNPPFGKNSSLAIKFFNHSSQFAKYIAFIVPRTFRKTSIKNRLNLFFELVDEMVLPLDSFHTPENITYSVPTTFQIWKKLDKKRQKVKKTKLKCNDWDWTDDKTAATHAIRRVGVKAGYIYKDPISTSEPSHYYIISKNPNLESLWKQTYSKFWKVEHELNPKWDVAGNPSLSKDEIICYYELYKKTINFNFIEE